MFTDELTGKVWDEIRQQDIRAFTSKITLAVIAEAAGRTRIKLVKSPLCVGDLVWLAIATAMHMGVDFATILTQTLQLLEDQQEFPPSQRWPWFYLAPRARDYLEKNRISHRIAVSRALSRIQVATGK